MIYNILADKFAIYSAIELGILIALVLCALVVIIGVLAQQGNSNGISALGGSSDTFYSKNKKKSNESRRKMITVVCVILMAVLMIAYFLIEVFFKF